MDNPARVNPLGAVTEADKAAAQAALLAGYTTSKIIGPLSFQKNQVQELVLGGDLAGLTAVPDYFACYFNNLTAVDLSGLSGVTSFRDGFLAGCSRLNSLDLTPLSGVTSVEQAFLYTCYGLTGVVNMGTITADRITQYYGFYNSGSGPIKVLSTEVQNYKDKFQGNAGEQNDGRFVAQ